MNNKLKIIIKNLFLFCLVALALLTSLYFLVLGWYNTISLDDYGFITSVEQNGVLRFVIDTYYSWQGRFTTFLGSGLTMVVFGRAKNLIFLTVLMLLSGWWIFGLILKGIDRRYGLGVPQKIILPVSVVTVNVGILSFFEPSTFFWMCGLGYTLSIWMTVLLVYLIFYGNGKMWLRWIGVVICSFYISGTSENYTPLVIGAFILIKILSIFNFKIFKNHSENAMLTVSIVIMIIGCIFMILAPGNSVRLAAYGLDSGIAAMKMSIGNLLLTIARCSIVILLRIFSISYYFILFFLLLVGVGSFCSSSSRNNLGRQLLIVLLLFLFLIISSVAICVVGVGGNPPLRALSFISFGVITLCAYLGIKVGAAMGNREKKRLTSIISIFFLLIIGAMKFFHDIPIAKDYHDYITYRDNSIVKRSKETNDKSPYVCKSFDHEWGCNNYSKLKNIVYELIGKEHSFYEPQMIYMESNLSSDPNDFRNVGLKEYLDVDFDIICDESSDKGHID